MVISVVVVVLAVAVALVVVGTGADIEFNSPSVCHSYSLSFIRSIQLTGRLAEQNEPTNYR